MQWWTMGNWHIGAQEGHVLLTYGQVTCQVTSHVINQVMRDREGHVIQKRGKVGRK